MKKPLLTYTPSTAGWLALFAGCLAAQAFAPFSLFPLAIVGLALLQFTLEGVSPRRAALHGWLFGLGLFGCGIYWVFICIISHSQVPSLLALGLTLLFISLMALFSAFPSWALNRFFPSGQEIRLFFAFPALWTLTEWLRSFIFTGFPWLTLGYSQLHSPLRGYAPVSSVFGVSMAVVFSSSLLLRLVREASLKKYRQMGYALLSLCLIWGTGAALDRVKWTHPEGKPVTVSLVQGNIPAQDKWSDEMLQPTLDIYTQLSARHWGSSNIVVWPESAIPDFLANQQEFVNSLDAIASQHNTAFITGIPVQLSGAADRYFNAVIALGAGKGYYLKHRLVPFGEYIPLKDSLSMVMNFLHIPLTGFTPATTAGKPLQAGPLKILAVICYESAFPEQVRFADPNIGMLLTVSNDAWYGFSGAQAQHLEITAMRALETGRPMLFASNDGPTAFINAQGRIESLAPARVPFVLTHTVQPMRGSTPWLSRGMDPLLMFSLVLLFRAIWRTRKAQRA